MRSGSASRRSTNGRPIRSASAIGPTHHDGPEFGFRYIADELAVHGLITSRNRLRTQQKLARKRGLHRKPGPPVYDNLIEVLTTPRPNMPWP